MSITVNPDLEARLRERAQAEGISVEAYLERLVRAEQRAIEELEALAREGLNSGPAVECGPEFWEAKHRRIDQRLRDTNRQ
jgi:hypothetical protein